MAKILLSAGGTGGHMSPAAALAKELQKRGHEIELATDNRGRKYVNMFPDDMPVHIIKSGTSGAGIMGKIKGGVNLAQGIVMQGFSLIAKVKPDMVVGFGGYPSVPAVFAAQLRRIPTGLHEQNAVLGKANKFLSSKAHFIALSLPSQEDVKGVIKYKMEVTGNPVRSEIIALKDANYPEFTNDSDFNIFVMGGSLGATVFSEVVPKAISSLPDKLKKRIKIVQQCREADIEQARSVYDKAGIDANLGPFFDDVAGHIAHSHLFIGRSGASTVAEMSIAGLPAIYVPYPHHKDQQQLKNAIGVADKAGAWIIPQDEFTPALLGKRIEGFFENSKILPETAMRAKECGLPDAVQRLADLALRNI